MKNSVRQWLGCGIAGIAALAAILAGQASSAGATTLMRAGLDDLVAGNDTVVVGEVLDAHSYWNGDRTFVLTDVRIVATDVLKGDPRDKVLTVTLLGGTVGDRTALILGGAELVPGDSYVLFLDREDLPGVRGARTVRDHVQGVFDVVLTRDGLRAVSQASRFPLLPDARGESMAPGGIEGLLLTSLMQSIRDLAERPQGIRREVK